MSLHEYIPTLQHSGSGMVFGIAFGLAFGLSLEFLQFKKSSKLLYHYEKNMNHFEKNISNEINNKFGNLYFEYRDFVDNVNSIITSFRENSENMQNEIDELKIKCSQLEEENKTLNDIFYDYLKTRYVTEYKMLVDSDVNNKDDEEDEESDDESVYELN